MIIKPEQKVVKCSLVGDDSYAERFCSSSIMLGKNTQRTRFIPYQYLRIAGLSHSAPLRTIRIQSRRSTAIFFRDNLLLVLLPTAAS